MTSFLHGVPMALVLLLGTMSLVECNPKGGFDIEELVHQEKYFSAHESGNLIRKMLQNARRKRHASDSAAKVKRDTHETLVDIEALNHQHQQSKALKALGNQKNKNVFAKLLEVQAANNNKKSVKDVNAEHAVLGLNVLETHPSDNADLNVDLLSGLD